MDNLEPITREEILLDGGDLTPITRKEMFIKRIYDKTQSVPEPITREEYFLAKAGEGSGGDVTIEQLNVTENGTYSESGTAYSPVIVDVQTPPIPENAYLLNNLSGLPADIASFNDGTDLPMASLKVAVTPYQDLHGQDAPWAGGAGKNKCNAQNPIVLSAAGNIGEQPCIIPSGTYTYSWTSSANTAISLTLWKNGAQIGQFASASSIQGRGSLTFTISSDADTLKCYYNAPTTISDIQVESGNTATSYAPYSNICPISGWDESKVTRCGGNLYAKANNIIITKPIPNGTKVYTQIFGGTFAGASLYGKSNTTDWISLGTISQSKNVITINRNDIIELKISSSAYGDLIRGNSDLMVSFTDFDDFEPYNGATYTIDLNGTRYGGVVDATNGTMDDTLDYIASYNGETLPSTWISDRDVYAEGTTPTVGAEVVYTRATPITVQLAPQPVKSIEGENNIFANCGQITEVKYFKKA